MEEGGGRERAGWREVGRERDGGRKGGESWREGGGERERDWGR